MPMFAPTSKQHCPDFTCEERYSATARSCACHTDQRNRESMRKICPLMSAGNPRPNVRQLRNAEYSGLILRRAGLAGDDTPSASHRKKSCSRRTGGGRVACSGTLVRLSYADR